MFELTSLIKQEDIISVATRPDFSLYEEGLERWIENFETAQSKFDCVMTFGNQPVISHAAQRSNAKDKPLKLVPENQQCQYQVPIMETYIPLFPWNRQQMTG